MPEGPQEGPYMSHVLETDSRSRLTLPGGRANRRYLVHEESDGTLILEPAVVISEREARFQADAELQTRIAHAQVHPETRRPRPPRRTQ